MQQSAGGHNAHFLLPFVRGMRTQRPTHTKWIGTKHATVLFYLKRRQDVANQFQMMSPPELSRIFVHHSDFLRLLVTPRTRYTKRNRLRIFSFNLDAKSSM